MSAPGVVRGRVLVRGGEARGPLVRLSAPLSFWGGLDPGSGVVSDPRHPDHGRGVGGSVLAIPESVGSSSSSAIMLEMLREGTAPVALILGRVDAIVALGVVVARELGVRPVPVLEADWGAILALPEPCTVRIGRDGSIVPEL